MSDDVKSASEQSSHGPESTAGERWEYQIIFRHNKTKKCPTGLKTVFGTIEEIEDLHEIIEAGPDWNTIKDIRIKLVEDSTITVEQSKRR